MQKFLRPLEGQVVRHHEKGLLAQAQAFGLHGGGGHLEGLARAHLVGKQGVAAVQNVSNSVPLMLPQGDLRVHAHKMDVAAIVFPWPGGVEQLVVLPHQYLSPLGVLPDPVCKGVLDGLLLLPGQHGLLFVQHPLGLAAVILHRVVDPRVPKVEGVLQNFVGAGPGCAEGLIGHDVIVACFGLALDPPLRGGRGKFDPNGVP